VKVPLAKIAHTRSGDKGDTCNIGVIAYDARHYPVLVRELTAGRVKAFFGDRVKGKVERFELPNLSALNFLLHEALGRRHGFAAHRRAGQNVRRSPFAAGDRHK